MSLQPAVANVDLLVVKPHIFSVCTQLKHRGYIKPNTTDGKTGYKWKTAVDEGLLYLSIVYYRIGLFSSNATD
jgi:hypothetical protein